MARVVADLKELKELKNKFIEISKNTDKACKYSLYDAAGLAAGVIRAGIDGLHVVSDAAAIQAWKHNTPTYICYTQRAGLYQSLGLTPMKKRNGVWSIAAGIDNKDPVTGYNAIKTKRWPKGQPNIMIAASCEHGSSAMLAQPFIRPAFENNRNQMQKMMKEACQRWIQATLDGKAPRSSHSYASKKTYRSSNKHIWPKGVWTWERLRAEYGKR